jgi:predicted DNA-binding transcriptional regulator YafY
MIIINHPPTTVEKEILSDHALKTRMITVRYKNYRGEIAVRTLVPVKLWWGSNEYHTQEQWLLTAWDIERNAYRDYALQDIVEFIK